jgi:phage shock protein C
MQKPLSRADYRNMTDYSTPPTPPTAALGPRRLHRSTKERMIGGVAGGLAEYLNVDPTAVRIGFVAASLLLGGLGGPVLYALAWAILPEDGKDSRLLRDFL